MAEEEEEMIEIHQMAVDSMHPSHESVVYSEIVKEKTNSLLMDLEVQQNMNILPEGVVYAYSYIRSILIIMSKYSDSAKEILRELNKQFNAFLKTLGEDNEIDFIEGRPKVIVEKFESECITSK